MGEKRVHWNHLNRAISSYYNLRMWASPSNELSAAERNEILTTAKSLLHAFREKSREDYIADLINLRNHLKEQFDVTTSYELDVDESFDIVVIVGEQLFTLPWSAAVVNGLLDVINTKLVDDGYRG